MDIGSIIQAVSLLILLIITLSFFTGAQDAYKKASRTRLKSLASEGNKSAQRALYLIEDDYLFLMFFAVRNLIKIYLVLILNYLLLSFEISYSFILTAIIIFIAIIFFGEVPLQEQAKKAPEKFACIASFPIRIFLVIFYPLCILLSLWKGFLYKTIIDDSEEIFNEEELLTIVDEAESEGGLDEHESELIRSAIEFNDLEARQLLTPRVDVIAVEDISSIDEISEVFRTHGFSRIPVYHDTIDNIKGILHEKDFHKFTYEKNTDLNSILREPVFITESMKISKLLRLFQESKIHMAVVVDEFGGTAGLITLEDVLEELVGDIWDEHDEVVSDITEIGEDTYLVNCNAPFEVVSEKFDFSNVYEYSTVGSWVLENLEKQPEIGDSFIDRGLHTEITKTDGRRAVEVRIYHET